MINASAERNESVKGGMREEEEVDHNRHEQK